MPPVSVLSPSKPIAAVDDTLTEHSGRSADLLVEEDGVAISKGLPRIHHSDMGSMLNTKRVQASIHAYLQDIGRASKRCRAKDDATEDGRIWSGSQCVQGDQATHAMSKHDRTLPSFRLYGFELGHEFLAGQIQIAAPVVPEAMELDCALRFEQLELVLEPLSKIYEACDCC